VNHEVCRQLGIASVVVMPVVNDDEVLGVFELFSGKANAFGARDVSAVQRLSEMVETAVRLAQATSNLPDRLKMREAAAVEIDVSVVEGGTAPEGKVLDGEVLGDTVREEPLVEDSVAVAVFVEERIAKENLSTGTPALSEAPTLSQRTRKDGAPCTVEIPGGAAGAHETTATKKKLYWSAALTSAGDAGKLAEPDQSHVPPVLRSLRKCDACGFPISAGRVLCVECEEKKWRGHLRVPKIVGPRPAAIPSPFAAKAAPVLPASKPEVRAFAAAQAGVVSGRAVVPGLGMTAGAVAVSPAKKSNEVAQPTVAAVQAPARSPALSPAPSAAIPEPVNPAIQPAKTEFVLSAGLEPSQSWLSANKYIIGVLLLIGGGAAAIFLLR
jgi:hypothetical protein